MPTEAGQAEARSIVQRAMAGETNEQLARRAQIDPQTLGDFLAGRRWPRTSTLAKIERALGMTPGTLAAIGEEGLTVRSAQDNATVQRALREATASELLMTLAHKIAEMQNQVDELESQRREDSLIRQRGGNPDEQSLTEVLLKTGELGPEDFDDDQPDAADDAGDVGRRRAPRGD